MSNLLIGRSLVDRSRPVRTHGYRRPLGHGPHEPSAAGPTGSARPKLEVVALDHLAEQPVGV